MDTEKLLQEVKDGKLSIEEAMQELKNLPYEEMGFAKLDHHRKVRSGYAEVVYCAGKENEHLARIYQKFCENGTDVMGTRATQEQFAYVKALVPDVCYDPISRILKVHKNPQAQVGSVAVCAAGTSDISVAEEAAQTAEFMGAKVSRVYDVGVAGIHRLFSQMDVLQKANCIVAVAGMEGALAGVVAGLVPNPVVAVPTSVGYGASFHGVSALLTMLNSCANGITVVNIDNGYGAGYSAAQINRMAVTKHG
ncbi:MAG: nickel pincer cofactor biosynthesis protein LarB [Lachnospiraceae bacterium]